MLSEPELDQAFSNSRQTIDILSAAGNLQERRRIHGGYGTPSSYASEQEMKLYFDNTPNPDPNTEAFLNENIDKTSKNNVESSLYTISLLDDKMKDEIISVQTQGKIKIIPPMCKPLTLYTLKDNFDFEKQVQISSQKRCLMIN